MHRTGYHQEGRHAPAPAAALLALCLLVAGVQALTIPIDDAALAAGADEIVRGEITGVHAGWTADHTQIVTTASVRVKGRAKGSGADTLTLSVPGGTVENVTQWVEDQPTLLPGTEAFVFVKHGGEGDRVYGGQRGVVPVEQGRVRGNARTKGGGVPADAYGRYLGELAAGRAAAAPASEPAPRAAAATTPVIARVSPDTASAGTGTTITITGTGFGTKASRESYADVGFVQRFFPVSPIWASGAPRFSNNVNDVVSWSDTEIVVRVPTGVTGDWYPGSASSGYVWVITDQNVASGNYPFTVTFGYGKDKWGGPASYRINPDGFPTGVVGAITNAGATWNAAVPGAGFHLDYAGTSSNATFGRDGESLVILGPFSDFDVSVAALATWFAVDGQITEADIEFSPRLNWQADPAIPGPSLTAVGLHELGHWLSLRDLYGFVPGYPTDAGKVMFGIANDAPLALRPDDVSGIRWIYRDAEPAPPPNGTIPRPYPGPHPVPGRVEAEDFDSGGEGVAYHDTEPANLGNAYRTTDGVDVEAGGGVTDVGWVRRGEWLSYTVNATVGQSVVLRLRASNPDAATKQIIIYGDGAPLAGVVVPATGSFSTFTTIVSDRPFWLPAGETVLRLSFERSERVNLDSFELAPAVLPDTTITRPPMTFISTPTPTPTLRPYPGPHEVPCTVEAEDYDTGGEGIAYHDTTAGNSGGAYRADDVDLGASGGTTYVTDVRDGEWLAYTVNASAPQDVVVRLRAANPGAVDREVPVFADGLFLTTAVVPPTGSATNFTTVDSSEFPVGAGETEIRLRFLDGDGPVMDRFEVVASVPPLWALEITEPGRYVLDRDLAGGINGVRITSSNVVLDGAGHAVVFSGAAGSSFGTGVEVRGPLPEAPLANVTVRNLSVRGWSQGLDLMDATGVLVEGVTAAGNSGWGLRTTGCDAVTVRSSAFSGNDYFGVALYTPGAGFRVEGCSATENGMAGVGVVGARDAGSVPVLEANDVRDNPGWGIVVEQPADVGGGVPGTAGAVVRDSAVLRNDDGGIVVRRCEAVVRGNRVDDNGGPGVSVILGGTARVTRNRVGGNPIGLAMGSVGDPSTLEAWDNVLNNTANADFAAGGTIRLNATRSAGPNIVGGPSIGGNFWGTPDGTGFSQTHADRDGDGFVDEPFVDPSGAVDHLPLAPAPAVVAVPGGAGLPSDTNGDGRYDDVNANGRTDFADVVLYFDRMDWIAANEPVSLFDYNANGRVDFADVVWLFDRL